MRNHSKIGLGTVQFGLSYGISNTAGKTPHEEVSAILEAARAFKIDVLDTAFAYGEAERVLGKNDLSSFRIVSKFRSLTSGESPLSQLHDTLKSLKVRTLYGYLAHRPMDIIDFPNSWDQLCEAKSLGLVEKIGFSLNDPNEFEILTIKKGFLPDLVQVPYNYLDRRFERIFKYLRQINCEVHTRSVFLQGLFFMDPESLPSFFDEIKPIIRQMQIGCDNLPASLLNFVLANPFIDKVIIGVNNVEQFLSNLKCISNPMRLPDVMYTLPDRILMPLQWPRN